MKKKIQKQKKVKKLVIVAGSAGEIGTEFIKRMVAEGTDCIAIIRNTDISLESPHLKKVKLDLRSSEEISKKMSRVDFSLYDQVYFLHTIGVDKFDPRGYPKIKPMSTIDTEVYGTNVNTFKYLLKYLASRIEKDRMTHSIGLKVAIIAGVADKYAPFVIESFCEAKHILRGYINSYVSRYPKWISGLSVNVTSTITRSALAVRPNADTKYWLTPSEVVGRSYSELIKVSKKYKEINIIKINPNYFDGYYLDDAVLYEKWSKETEPAPGGGKVKNIAHE